MLANLPLVKTSHMENPRLSEEGTCSGADEWGARIQNQAFGLWVCALGTAPASGSCGGHKRGPWRRWAYQQFPQTAEMAVGSAAELSSEEMKPQLAQVLKAVIKYINFLCIFGK